LEEKKKSECFLLIKIKERKCYFLDKWKNKLKITPERPFLDLPKENPY
jgi:hypothetical protein